MLGFVWHLVLFEDAYKALAIYRVDIIIPFGLLSMLIQAFAFAFIYERVFSSWEGGFLRRAAAYGALGAVLSWSFTRLAVAAKNSMSSFRTISLSRRHSQPSNGSWSLP
jgi:hypothetical protein